MRPPFKTNALENALSGALVPQSVLAFFLDTKRPTGKANCCGKARSAVRLPGRSWPTIKDVFWGIQSGYREASWRKGHCLEIFC
jgi:hypothetical protein